MGSILGTTLCTRQPGGYAPTPGLNAPGGTVLVTAHGAGTERCKVGAWGQWGNDTVVEVYCFDPSGNPVDTTFTLSFLTDVAVGQGDVDTSTYFGGYVWANEPRAASYTPSTGYQLNTATNDRNTITRSSSGVYRVRFPALNPQISAAALVAAYGPGPEYCTVGSWGSDGSNGTVVLVQCFDASGNPVDTTFALTYLTDAVRPG